MGISTVILAYKEAENLDVLIPDIKKNLALTGEEHEIIIIDTKEPFDNTREICDKYGALYFNQDGAGFANAFICGIRCASMDKFLILDGDGSHDPAYIPDIYEKFTGEDCDLVIGSRYIKGGRSEDKLSSVLMSRMLNFAFRLCIGIKAKDLSTDYRMYDTAQLKSVELQSVNYDVLEEVLLKLKLNKKGLKIGEVPIHFKKRVFGDSKRRLWEFIASYIKALFKLFGMRMKANKEFFKHLVLYGLFGAIAAGIDFGIFMLLISFTVMDTAIANIIGMATGFALTFTANMLMNFKKTTKVLRRSLSYALFALIGMGVSTGLLKLLEGSVQLWLLKAILIVLISLMQFFLNKRITYRD